MGLSWGSGGCQKSLGTCEVGTHSEALSPLSGGVMAVSLHGRTRLNHWSEVIGFLESEVGVGFEVPGLGLCRKQPCSEALTCDGDSKVLTFVSGPSNILRSPL